MAFHRHTWVDDTLNYHEPTGDEVTVNRSDHDFALVLLYGMTVVTQRCSKCGKTSSYTVPGDARNA